MYEYAVRRTHKTRSRAQIWWAIFWGVAPDVFSFGVFVVANFFITGSIWPAYSRARAAQQLGGFGHWITAAPSVPNPAQLPDYLFTLYNISHSFVIFLAVFLLVWLFRRRPYWLMAGWGLHVLIDIFSHSEKFFPTPVFWPISSYHIPGGISWGTPAFMVVNYLAIIAAYLYLSRSKRRMKLN